MLFGQLEDDRREREQGDEVRNRHQSVKSVCDIPYRVDRADTAHNDDDAEEDLIRTHCFHTEQILNAACSVQGPAEDRGIREHHQREGHKKRRRLGAEDGGEGRGNQFTARFLTEGDVHAADDNGQCGQGADQDGVYKYLEDTEDPLLYRSFAVRCRVRDRSGAKAGFVGERGSSQTPDDRVFEQDAAAGAGNSLWIERAYKDFAEAFSNHINVAEDDD